MAKKTVKKETEKVEKKVKKTPLTDRAEILLQDLSLRGLLEIVTDICKKIE